MTGFGAAEGAVGSRRARVEIRTVNHRFFHLVARLPGELGSQEAALREVLRRSFDRGHLAVTLTWVDDDAGMRAGIDLERAAEARAALDALRDTLGLDGEVTLDMVLRFPNVVDAGRERRGEPVEWADAVPVIEAAAADCVSARAREGTVLSAEIVTRLDAVDAAARTVEGLLPARLARELERLRASVAAMAGDSAVSEERLALEIALLADRADVTEELVRLRAHVGAARAALEDGAPVGKRLGFLAQELGREVNTIGSKANDAEIAHLVVAMKGELEKVREQLENLE
jgi:uncharacterized protein (TIGR00255 family)